MNKQMLAAAYKDGGVAGGRTALRSHLEALLTIRQVSSAAGTFGVLRSGQELLTAIGADQYAVARVLADIVAESSRFQAIRETTWQTESPKWQVEVIKAAMRKKAA